MSGGEVQCPPDGSGFRLTATISCSATQRSNSAITVARSTPGDCGSMAEGTKRSGYSSETRPIKSLQWRDQAAEVSKSPAWWAIKDARGENTCTSMPRSFKIGRASCRERGEVSEGRDGGEIEHG